MCSDSPLQNLKGVCLPRRTVLSYLVALRFFLQQSRLLGPWLPGPSARKTSAGNLQSRGRARVMWVLLSRLADFLDSKLFRLHLRIMRHAPLHRKHDQSLEVLFVLNMPFQSHFYPVSNGFRPVLTLSKRSRASQRPAGCDKLHSASSASSCVFHTLSGSVVSRKPSYSCSVSWPWSSLTSPSDVQVPIFCGVFVSTR